MSANRPRVPSASSPTRAFSHLGSRGAGGGHPVLGRVLQDKTSRRQPPVAGPVPDPSGGPDSGRRCAAHREGARPGGGVGSPHPARPQPGPPPLWDPRPGPPVPSVTPGLRPVTSIPAAQPPAPGRRLAALPAATAADVAATAGQRSRSPGVPPPRRHGYSRRRFRFRSACRDPPAHPPAACAPAPECPGRAPAEGMAARGPDRGPDRGPRRPGERWERAGDDPGNPGAGRGVHGAGRRPSARNRLCLSCQSTRPNGCILVLNDLAVYSPATPLLQPKKW